MRTALLLTAAITCFIVSQALINLVGVGTQYFLLMGGVFVIGGCASVYGAMAVHDVSDGE